MPRQRFARLVLVPILLFAAFSSVAFTLAKLHFAKPGVPRASGNVVLGDAYRGETVFSQNCATCHGQGGSGGIGPRLDGLAITLARAKAQIDNGAGTMPAGLVTGRQEQDVLAYLDQILATP